MEVNEIYKGDCLELMKDIPTNSVDMILCDLPFGQTARNKWDSVIPFEPLWQQYNRIIKDNGAIVLFANGMFTADLMQSNRKMWRYNLVWEKTQPTGFLNAKKMPLRAHEDICVFYKKLGLCTDICVVSNALALRMFYPSWNISVDESCCAGVTTKKHKAALEVMKSCQIDVTNSQKTK